MVEYKDRLAWAMKEAKRSRTDLAKRLNVSYQAVRKVLLGETNSFTAENNEVAAAYLGVSSRWLATGLGRFDDYKAVTKLSRSVTVPLMSWESIRKTGGDLRKLDGSNGVGEWIATGAEHQRPAAFALTVHGDAMASQTNTEPSFPDGTIILVDPGEPGGHGDYVLATDPSSREPTFKRLMQDGGRWFLRPINTAYPTTEIQDPQQCVLGRVFEYQLRRKL